ncbi:MAG: hypothetical protein ACRC1K_12975 [Planctomycetia bacterium]
MASHLGIDLRLAENVSHNGWDLNHTILNDDDWASHQLRISECLKSLAASFPSLRSNTNDLEVDVGVHRLCEGGWFLVKEFSVDSELIGVLAGVGASIRFSVYGDSHW